MKKRPLCELTAWANPLLDIDEGRKNNRKKFIDIAAKESPSKTFELVAAMAYNYGFGPELVQKVARAARWLAIILRDYGQAEFDKLTEGKR
ncbi:MAG: hypothetical protein ABIA08_02130 [bacterium]